MPRVMAMTGGSVALATRSRRVGEVIGDHSAGGSHLLVAGVEAQHLLVTSEGLPDLAFDQAEQQQGQADHRDQCGDAPVVLVIDFGDLCAGDPACDLAAAWILLPDGAVERLYDARRPTPDAATRRRARGWAVLKALACVLIGEAGVHGRPGGKRTWGPPARHALRRLVATARQ